MTVMTKGT